jgi:hypothetical protein
VRGNLHRDPIPTTRRLRRVVGPAFAVAILALAAPGWAGAQEGSSPAPDRPSQPAAIPRSLTQEQLTKMIRLNGRIGTQQEIIGPAATVLRLTQNRDLPVHGLDCALGDGHEIDFAQFRQDTEGFVFTEMNRKGNFVFRVDSALRPIAAARIIGATSLSPIQVVALAPGDPEARENLDATLSAWARIIDRLAADNERGAGKP